MSSNALATKGSLLRHQLLDVPRIKGSVHEAWVFIGSIHSSLVATPRIDAVTTCSRSTHLIIAKLWFVPQRGTSRLVEQNPCSSVQELSCKPSYPVLLSFLPFRLHLDFRQRICKYAALQLCKGDDRLPARVQSSGWLPLVGALGFFAHQRSDCPMRNVKLHCLRLHTCSSTLATNTGTSCSNGT